ncbi:hypothetical protein POM88_025619 [Heracleum sosnowskyi]|uniref:Uncharacterized protein n=1 Tax=Heracleum sosnowskyi TaxID=360622 RepID=A0AAD8I5D5_9APIA|nr:hypothetical protein POM88_025619 [Heracleum sosnowskyi]
MMSCLSLTFAFPYISCYTTRGSLYKLWKSLRQPSKHLDRSWERQLVAEQIYSAAELTWKRDIGKLMEQQGFERQREGQINENGGGYGYDNVPSFAEFRHEKQTQLIGYGYYFLNDLWIEI